MEQQARSFAVRGWNVAAITYDSPAILKSFAARRAISYPLLADEGSKVIRAFGILNENIPKDSPVYGVPFPVTYLLDAKGRVRSKYVEEDYRERYSAANILVREFHQPGVGGAEIQARHLTIRTSASNAGVYAGSRILLLLDLVLPPKMHVYAPGVQGYIPIDWSMKESRGWMPLPALYPAARTLLLPAIGEKVPVYERNVRIARDLVVGQNAELKSVVDPGGATITLEGSFRYQACDDKVCYVPETVPLKWTFPVAPLDSERAPKELRRAFPQ